MTMFRTDDDLSTYTFVEVPAGTEVRCEPDPPGGILLIFGTHDRTILKLAPQMLAPLKAALSP
ncbi:MAG TPA: hypothetical protein VGL93_34555 [Streptosporangiaceae bacterium]